MDLKWTTAGKIMILNGELDIMERNNNHYVMNATMTIEGLYPDGYEIFFTYDDQMITEKMKFTLGEVISLTLPLVIIID